MTVTFGSVIKVNVRSLLFGSETLTVKRLNVGSLSLAVEQS